MNLIRHKNFGFIGMGKMGQTLVKNFIESGTLKKENVFVTNRSPRKLDKVVELYGVTALPNNEELVEKCEVVFVCVKPQDFGETLHPISSLFGEHHWVLSLAAGVDIKTLKKGLPGVKNIIRIMPNTPAKLAKGVVGYCLAPEAAGIEESIRALLSSLGLVVKADEGDQMRALTIACASGVGFIFELMMYWQDWLEDAGFEPDLAKLMTIQTFLGTSMVAAGAPLTALQVLQEEVTSKKGVTFAGLEAIREEEIERILRMSFEKAVIRDQELGKTYS
jgi:pyrroline-5-carboxylate reductase